MSLENYVFRPHYEEYVPQELQVCLAEDLPSAYAYSQMRAFSTKRGAEGRLQSAWRHVEFALCQGASVDDKTRSSIIDLSSYLLNEPFLSENTSATALCRCKAELLSSYLPLFSKRALKQMPTSEDMANLYVSLGKILAREYKEAAVGGRPALSFCNEILMMAVTARTLQPNMVLYPTSIREEGAHQADLNHDNYFILNGKKVPVQMTTAEAEELAVKEARYSDDIHVFNINRLVRNAMQRQNRIRYKMPQIEHLSIDDCMPIAGLVIDEAEGDSLYPAEEEILNTTSQLAVRLYRESCGTALAPAA